MFDGARVDIARFVIETDHLVDRSDCAEERYHPFGRILGVMVNLAAIIGLMSRPFINGIDAVAQWIEEVRLNTASQVRTDLEV